MRPKDWLATRAIGTVRVPRNGIFTLWAEHGGMVGRVRMLVALALFALSGLAGRMRGAGAALWRRLAARRRPLPPTLGMSVGAPVPRTPAASQDSELLPDLERGLANGQLVPFFQPQIEARTGRLVGLEALIRWRHPARGLLLPAAFLAPAEAAGLAPRLTARMLDTALAALAVWRAEGLAIPQVSINLTAQELRDPGLAPMLAGALDRVGLAPGDLAIEILESALSREPEDPVPRVIEALADAGHPVDLDDFGRGTATLEDLDRLAIGRVKIDRSLVKDISAHPRRRSMIKTLMDRAHGRDVRVVGEGVERAEEVRMLTNMGCDHLQGFAIGRPMREQDVPIWLASHAHRCSTGRIIAAA